MYKLKNIPPFSLSLSVQTSSRQIPLSYSASTSKKHDPISVDGLDRMYSLALRYNRTCVAKLSTTVPVQKSSQSISRNLIEKNDKMIILKNEFLVYNQTSQTDAEWLCTFHV